MNKNKLLKNNHNYLYKNKLNNKKVNKTYIKLQKDNKFN